MMNVLLIRQSLEVQEIVEVMEVYDILEVMEVKEILEVMEVYDILEVMKVQEILEVSKVTPADVWEDTAWLESVVMKVEDFSNLNNAIQDAVVDLWDAVNLVDYKDRAQHFDQFKWRVNFFLIQPIHVIQ
jgi:hypothetical protein